MVVDECYKAETRVCWLGTTGNQQHSVVGDECHFGLGYYWAEDNESKGTPEDFRVVNGLTWRPAPSKLGGLKF